MTNINENTLADGTPDLRTALQKRMQQKILSKVEVEDDNSTKTLKRYKKIEADKNKVFTNIPELLTDEIIENDSSLTEGTSILVDAKLKDAGKDLKSMKTSTAKMLESDTDDLIRDRWYILGKDSQFVKYWELFIIVCAIYNTITVPLTFAFEEIADLFKNPDRYGETGALYWFDLFVDAIYFVDIVTSFLTSYLDTRSGDEIKSPKRIAMNYLNNGFLLDFISVLPVICDFFLEPESDVGQYIGLLSLLKMTRVFRLSRMVETMNAPLNTKTTLKIGLVISAIGLFYHLVGSMMIFLVKIKKEWWPALDFMYVSLKPDGPYEGWENTKNTKMYVAMVYEAALAFSLVEFNPRTSTEIFILTVIMLVSAIINAQIFGQFAVLQEVEGAEAEAY
jgi:hypothetical protein